MIVPSTNEDPDDPYDLSPKIRKTPRPRFLSDRFADRWEYKEMRPAPERDVLFFKGEEYEQLIDFVWFARRVALFLEPNWRGFDSEARLYLYAEYGFTPLIAHYQNLANVDIDKTVAWVGTEVARGGCMLCLLPDSDPMKWSPRHVHRLFNPSDVEAALNTHQEGVQ